MERITDYAIYAKGLKYSYAGDDGKKTEALKGIDMRVKHGEFVAVLGHNGSGKSTFARHINVLISPQQGELKILGMDAADPENTWHIRSRAGMVFQNPDNQIVSSIVEEDVAFGPENLGIPSEEIRIRVDEALAAVDMSAYARRAPHMLSGGQKQRIAIAGILAMRPDIIVFDEPTAMLDPQGRDDVMRVIHKLNREYKKTVMLITHYMEEAVGCDTVYVMNDGRIIDSGTPQEVFSHSEILGTSGLMPPAASRIADKLGEAGIALGGYPVTLDELVDEICLLKQ